MSLFARPCSLMRGARLLFAEVGGGWCFCGGKGLLLGEVSSACGRTRYFPRAGKYPKGAGGGQRVHAAWPPPVPPLLSNSAPLASQGRAQLGSHPYPGGPLSPSAQLIPPPAPRRRSILGVMARYRYGRNTLWQYVLRPRCRAKCVPALAPIGCWPRTKPNGVPVTDPVGRDTRGSAPFGTRGVRGYPSAV